MQSNSSLVFPFTNNRVLQPTLPYVPLDLNSPTNGKTFVTAFPHFRECAPLPAHVSPDYASSHPEQSVESSGVS